MKKNVKFIIIIIFLLFISEISNSTNFKFIINKENIICYNDNINKKEIEEYLTFYSDVVNNFYVKNNLTIKKIENEKILIILCINSFDEWIYAKKSRNKIKKALKYDKYVNILDREALMEYDYKNLLSAYVYDSILPFIVLKIKNNDFFKYFELMSEYNHHLIKTNLIKNKTEEYFQYGIDWLILYYLLDEGFTNYFFTYLHIFHTKNLGNFLYDKDIKLESEKAKILYEYFKKNLIKNNYEFKFYYTDLLNFKQNTVKIIENTYNYDYIKLFMSYINYFYGFEKLCDLMCFLYNKYYTNINEVFEKVFNMSINKFFEILDKRLYN